MSVDVSQYTTPIKTAVKASDVRNNIADGIDAIASEVNSYEAILSADNDQFKDDIGTRQTNLENTFNAEIKNSTSTNPSSVETIAGRTDNINNKTYDTLGKRLDAQSSQLADIANLISNLTPIYDDNYRLIFFDDFKNNFLDKTIWDDSYLASWVTNQETAKAKYTLADSNLNLTINSDSQPWCPEFDTDIIVSSVLTGNRTGLHHFNSNVQVRSHMKKFMGFICKYGKFEIRAKLTNSLGNLCAWWLVGIQDTIQQDVEIDVFECAKNFGANVIKTSLHKHDDTNVSEQSYTYTAASSIDLGNEFHTYTFEWTPTGLTFYLDGTQYYTVNANIVYPLLSLLSVYEARTGAWFGSFDSSAPYPKQFEIDYMKVWKKVPDGYSKIDKLEIVSQDIDTFTIITGQYTIEDGDILGLPSYVTLRYNDGTDTQQWVKWQPITSDIINQLNTVGTFVLEGDILGVPDGILGARKAKINIVVEEEAEITNIYIKDSPQYLSVGDTVQLVPTIEPSNIKTAKLAWRSSDTSIATVDQNGFVTIGNKGGVVYITCWSISDYTKKGICAIHVASNVLVTDGLEIYLEATDGVANNIIHNRITNSNYDFISNLSLTGSWNSGLYNNALEFDGIDDYLKSQNAYSLGTDDFTFEMYFSLYDITDTSDYVYFRLMPDVSPYPGLIFGYNSLNKLYVQFSDGTVKENILNIQSLYNTYNLISVVRKSNLIYVYLNGSLIFTGTKVIGNPNVSTNISIGASLLSSGVAGSFARFDMATFRKYNRALNSDEIKQNYLYENLFDRA